SVRRGRRGRHHRRHDVGRSSRQFFPASGAPHDRRQRSRDRLPYAVGRPPRYGGTPIDGDTRRTAPGDREVASPRWVMAPSQSPAARAQGGQSLAEPAKILDAPVRFGGPAVAANGNSKPLPPSGPAPDLVQD